MIAEWLSTGFEHELGVREPLCVIAQNETKDEYGRVLLLAVWVGVVV